MSVTNRRDATKDNSSDQHVRHEQVAGKVKY